MPYTPTHPSPNLLVLQSYVAALEKRDLEAIMSVFDDTLEHQIFPLSMGRPVQDKQGHREVLGSIMLLFQKFEVRWWEPSIFLVECAYECVYFDTR
jgi:hypothetical protein